MRKREVRAHLLLRNSVSAALQTLGVKTYIPSRELASREGFQFLELLQRGIPSGSRQLLQELHDFIDAVSHSRGQGILSITAEVEKPRSCVSQAKYLFHHGGVVPSLRVRSLVRCPSRPSFIKRTSHCLGLSVRDYRDVGGLIQRENPSLHALFMTTLSSLLDKRRVQTAQLRFIGN